MPAHILLDVNTVLEKVIHALVFSLMLSFGSLCVLHKSIVGIRTGLQIQCVQDDREVWETTHFPRIHSVLLQGVLVLVTRLAAVESTHPHVSCGINQEQELLQPSQRLFLAQIDSPGKVNESMGFLSFTWSS